MFTIDIDRKILHHVPDRQSDSQMNLGHRCPPTLEHIYIEHGQAWFQLKEHLEQAHVSHPNDSVVEECPLDDVVDDEVEQDIEITVAIQDDAWHASSEWKWLQAQFGCQRMHNEELMVVPCRG